MTNRRTSNTAVAALVLTTLLSTGVANAQDPPLDLGVIVCQSQSDPTIVSAGMSEPVGDIVLMCANIPPQRADFPSVTSSPTSMCR